MALGSFSLEVMDPDNISGWKYDNFSGTENLGDDCILFDWFSMSCKFDSVNSIIDLIGFSDKYKSAIKWEETYGFYGYRRRFAFDGINIHYDHYSKDSDFPLLEMTGQGCRAFDTYTDGNWQRLFNAALSPEDGYHITRLDVAYDDHSGILDINKLTRKTIKREFVARSQTGIITDTFRREIDAISIMFGTRKSDFYIRIYDKARERGYTDGRHWIRCESVFKDERAFNFIKNNLPLGQKYCGVLKNYLRFVEPSKTDTNKRRWKTSPFWDKFLGCCDRISVYTSKNVEYNLSRIGRYVFHQAGNSVDTYIKCVGLTRFLEDLKLRDTKLSVHQKRIINEYRARLAAEECNTDLPQLITAAPDDWVTRGLNNDY